MNVGSTVYSVFHMVATAPSLAPLAVLTAMRPSACRTSRARRGRFHCASFSAWMISIFSARLLSPMAVCISISSSSSLSQISIILSLENSSSLKPRAIQLEPTNQQPTRTEGVVIRRTHNHRHRVMQTVHVLSPGISKQLRGVACIRLSCGASGASGSGATTVMATDTHGGAAAALDTVQPQLRRTTVAPCNILPRLHTTS